MVLVVVRELGPLLTALLVLSRSGTANVIELGTARALGEVEALEALGIDPMHYSRDAAGHRHGAGGFFADGLFHHRRAGQRVSVGVFAGRAAAARAIISSNWPTSLSGLDFAILAIKSCLFGVIDCGDHLLPRAGAAVAAGGSVAGDDPRGGAKHHRRACCSTRFLFSFTLRSDHGCTARQ